MKKAQAMTAVAGAEAALADYQRGKGTELQLWEAMHGLVADKPQSRARQVLEKMIPRLRSKTSVRSKLRTE